MKIGFFITARLKSSRLKHKIILDLNGRPIIQRIIERCKTTKGIDGVVLCTSTNSQDSILYDFAIKNNIQFWAGSEDDVLKRLLSAAEYYGYDAFLSITADNPLFSIYISHIAVDCYKQENFDFIFTKGLPIGLSPYFIKTNALKVAHFMKNETDTEIWGPFVNRPDFFNIGEIIIKNSPFKEERRLTCDYPEDYYLLSKLYSHFDENRIPDIHDIFDVLRLNPEYWKINEMHTQKSISNELLFKIKNQFDNKVKDGREFAKKNNIYLKPGLNILKIEI